MDSVKKTELVDLFNEIFINKLSININCSEPTVIDTPFILNEYVVILSFLLNRINAIIFTLDKQTAKSIHDAVKEKINNDSDNIQKTLTVIMETILIKVVMQLYKNVKVYKEKLYSIKFYEIIEPQEFYYVNTETIKFDIGIDNQESGSMGSMNIYYVN